jgi:hypothetical protein
VILDDRQIQDGLILIYKVTSMEELDQYKPILLFYKPNIEKEESVDNHMGESGCFGQILKIFYY